MEPDIELPRKVRIFARTYYLGGAGAGAGIELPYYLLFCDYDSQVSKFYAKDMYDMTLLACVFDKAQMKYEIHHTTDGRMKIVQGMFGKKLVITVDV
jgi:hypothetical protein